MFSKTLWRVQNRRAMRCQGTVLFLALCSGACTAIQALIVAKIVISIITDKDEEDSSSKKEEVSEEDSDCLQGDS